MLSLRFSHVLFLGFLNYIDGQRRIKDGHTVSGEKRYMVYLAQAQSSIRNYDYWICGGCIVTRWYILTSAACVEDVQSMYAISGTKSYVSPADIYKNTCTQHTKKKVVFTCVPKEYELDFSKVESWSYNDIAIVKVETPYDFEIELYDTYCDYRPDTIKINLDVKNEQKGMDVIVLGYGHLNYWRQTYIKEDWNQPFMRYSSSKINSLKKCKKFYTSPDLFNNIEKYMICTNGTGSIDEQGTQLQESDLLFRKSSTRMNTNSTFRRQGFCQNDHGGPLVAWIKNEETVIGVASVFRVNRYKKCTGPYLYTSTARNKLFIECIIYDQMTRRNNECDQPASEKGFSILRRYILWNENEDHFVDNEEIKIRPQINMNFIGMG